MDTPSEENGRLLVSLDNIRVSDTMTLVGLLAAPQFAKYPYVDFWDYTVHVVVRSPGDILHTPKPLLDAIGGEKPTNLFFTVQSAPSTQINFIPHMWAFPDLQMGDKKGYENDQEVGIYTFGGSKASTNDMNWNTLGPQQIHIHPQKGGMCLSPNNGRIHVSADAISCVWSLVRIRDRTCVGLHWLIPPSIDFAPPRTITELLTRDTGPHVEALRFLMTGEGDLGELETPPKLSARNRPKAKAKKTPRGGSRSG